MFTNIATDILKLEINASYKPAWINKSALLKNPQESPLDTFNAAADMQCGNGQWSQRPVFRIHIGKNSLANTYYVRVWLWQMSADSFVDLPAVALKEGNVYDMYFDKYTIVDGSGVEQLGQGANLVVFGHRTTYMPIDHVMV